MISQSDGGTERTVVLSSVGPTLRLPRLGLDGWIDAVEIYDAESGVATMQVTPPVPVSADRPLTLPLTVPIPDVVSAVAVAYREASINQYPGPKRRRSFTRIARTDKEQVMNDRPDDVNRQQERRGTRHGSPANEDGRLSFTMATVDLGTTRSVGVVRDLNKPHSDHGRPLSAEAIRRARTVVDARPTKSGLGIDSATVRLPTRRQAAWAAAFSAPPLARERLEVIVDQSSDLVVLPSGSFDFRARRPHRDGSIVLRGVKRYLNYPDHQLGRDRSAGRQGAGGRRRPTRSVHGAGAVRR